MAYTHIVSTAIVYIYPMLGIKSRCRTTNKMETIDIVKASRHVKESKNKREAKLATEKID